MKEVLEVLRPTGGNVLLDGTLGAAGHAGALLEASRPGGFLIGLDRDSELLEWSRDRLIRSGWREGADFLLFHSRFSGALDLVTSGQVPQPQIVFFDFGLNSRHFDEPRRGFSFRQDGPLDMRMDAQRSDGPTAGDLVATLDQTELTRIFRDLGEERFAGRVAAALVHERARAPVDSTTRLAEIVAAAIPRKAWPPKTHPATRVFQALRMAVNEELDEIEGLLEHLPALIPEPGSRAGMIGFHSLELRPVKERLRHLCRSCFCPEEWPQCQCGGKAKFRLLTRGGLAAGPEEVAVNPRARSARFWAVERVLPGHVPPPPMP